jgi:hypothetical protein
MSHGLRRAPAQISDGRRRERDAFVDAYLVVASGSRTRDAGNLAGIKLYGIIRRPKGAQRHDHCRQEYGSHFFSFSSARIPLRISDIA